VTCFFTEIKMKHKFLVLFTSLLFASPVWSSEPIVITGATVIDGTGAPPQTGLSLVIEGERIAVLGKSADIAVPANAHVIHAEGKYVIPGLWDMHVHWYDEPSLPLFLVNGVTGVRIMCGFPVHLRWRSEVLGGKLLGPRFNLAGPIVDGPHPVWLDSIRAANATEGRRAVRTIKSAGYDCVKIYNYLPRDAFLGVAEEAKRLDMPLVGHVPYAVSALEATDARQKSIEHLNAISLACSSRETELRKRWLAPLDPEAPATAVHLRFDIEAEESYDAEKAAILFAHLVKNGAWVTPTLLVRHDHAGLRDREPASDPHVRWLPQSLAARWKTRRAATLERLGAADFDNYKRSSRKELELVKALHVNGVRLLAGTDTGALDCYAGFSLHEELELMVQAGLTPLEALQTATRNVGEYLGKQSGVGTIEKGKLADLVLLDANPLDDIRNARKIHAVVTSGRVFQPDDLKRLLHEVEESCKKENESSKPPGKHPKYP
jgi:imidazolonepropionase-like amidohydrolase